MGSESENPLGAGSSVYRAIVLDVITDISSTASQRSSYASSYNIKERSRIENAPLNSCIVRFWGAAASTISTPIVAYPFFSPHLAMPIKPGEAVWIISPDLLAPDVKDCYWVCRIPGSSYSEDTNFSHNFREPLDAGAGNIAAPSTSEKRDINSSLAATNILPGFSNNKGLGQILKGLKSDPGGAKDPFSDIKNKSTAYRSFVGEPVPHFFKRPGDLVIQGSNNSLICLGQDRAYNYDLTGDIISSLTNVTTSKPMLGTGTIDIVTGRSRYMPLKPATKDAEGDLPERTGNSTQANTRKYNEIDKRTFTSQEAELDFAVDASRIYVSMKTNGDKCFGLTSELGRMPTGFVSGSITPVDDAAYITLKSDELRLIARKQNENEYFPESTNPEINGSIKIIKEGVVNEDFAAVMLLPDGTIQINGSKIFLGRTIADGGIGGGPGEDESQPYVKYQELEDLFNTFMDDIKTFCDGMTAAPTPGYGAPSPAIDAAVAALKVAMDSRKGEIANIQSTRIFGE